MPARRQNGAYHMSKGTIVKVSGPLVIAKDMRDANMFDVVHVSDQGLIGEIIEMRGDRASIQVYEETSGLGPGAPVTSTGAPLSVELGPGLIGSIYDGIQRPLDAIMAKAGTNLERGVTVPSLNREKKWQFEPVVHAGSKVKAAMSWALFRRPRWWSIGLWCLLDSSARWIRSRRALIRWISLWQ